MSDKVDGKEGVKCECGHFEPFPAYVFAHWNDVLMYTCPECKRMYKLHRGIATKEGGGTWIAAVSRN